MKYWSTRRRHPLAGLVVVFFGLVVAAALYSAVRPAVAEEPVSADTDLIAEVRQLFVVGCSSCHGFNAEGIRTKSDANYGPPLIGVGAAAVDFQVGTGRMPLQQPGTQAPRKQPVYSEDETAKLAAYIASLGPGPAIPAEDAYDTSDVTVDEVVRGAQFFRTNCTACHNFAASGGALPEGRFAPSLIGVEPKYMYEAMLTGPQQMPVFSDETLSAEEKRGIIAYIEVLEDQPAYGGSDLGSLGPVTEGLWGWLIGVGSLVLAAVWIGNNGARAGKKR